MARGVEQLGVGALNLGADRGDAAVLDQDGSLGEFADGVVDR